jgi:phage terminase large subunit-like protein
MGIDLGFKNDGTAIVIVHKDRKTGKIILDYATVWFSGSSDVWEDDKSIYKDCNKYAGADLLKMADIVKEIKELHRWFPIKGGIFDQSNGYALAELIQKAKLKGINMVHFNDRKNSDVYQLAKRLYAEGLLQLFDHPVLIPEMLALEAVRKTSKGGNQSSEGGLSKGTIQVRAPNRKGSHDDISDAYVRAVWACYKGHKDKPLNVSTGAGGSIGVTGRRAKNAPDSMAPKQDTMASFYIRKKKMHGDHPRGAYKMKRRMPGAVKR